MRRVRSVKILLGPVLTAALVVLGGCSDDELSGYEKSEKSEKSDDKNKKKDKKDGSSGGLEKDTNKTDKVTKSIDNSGLDFQVKNMDLLRESVKNCFGEGMLAVQDDMLLPTDSTTQLPDPGDGKIRFLLGANYEAGDDIVDKERKNLVDTESSSRTGISGDSLTDTYLRSLETIGNVVAHNCSRDKELCDCSSKDKAMGMLKRCLPALNPETKEMVAASESLAQTCGGGIEGMREAVASLVSSYAFAEAR